MTKKVTHLVSGLFYGGGQRVVHDMLKANSDDLLQSLWLLGDQGNTCLNAQANGVVAYDGRYNRWKTLRSASRQVRLFLDLHRPDILHTHGLDADLIGALAIRGSSAIHLAHLHSLPQDQSRTWRAWIRRHVYKWSTRRAKSQFVAVADAVKRTNAKFYFLSESRIHTIRNGVDLGEFSDASSLQGTSALDKKIVFGCAGRLVPVKGHSFLIRAAGELAKSKRPFKILLAGSGSLEMPLRALAKEQGIEEQVEFLGQVSDMPHFYKSIDVLVLPSLTEGLPLVILEAMANGRPVIGTRVGGMEEVIRHGLDGLVVDPSDPKSLVKAMDTVFDTNYRKALGEAARRRVVESFSLDRVHREMCELYQKISRTSD